MTINIIRFRAKMVSFETKLFQLVRSYDLIGFLKCLYRNTIKNSKMEMTNNMSKMKMGMNIKIKSSLKETMAKTKTEME